MNVADAAAGDTQTIAGTLAKTADHLQAVADDKRVAAKIDERWLGEVVADKGYHSREVITTCQDLGLRTYTSEPRRGPQKWAGDTDARAAVHGNRRRIRGERGRRLLKRRGELLERSFAHCYETGGLRRLHLRGRDNLAKRLLVHAGGFNLGLLMRVRYGLKKPRGLTRMAASAFASGWVTAWAHLRGLLSPSSARSRTPEPLQSLSPIRLRRAA